MYNIASRLRKIDPVNIVIGLFTFVIIIDPPNTFLHLKDPLFLILLSFCVFRYKLDIKLLLPFFLSLIVWALSTCVGYSMSQIEDQEFNIGILKSLLPFILIGWIKNLNFKDKILFPCIVISIISIIVMIAMYFNPILERALYAFFTQDNGLMMIGKREFLGIPISSAFYRSTPTIIIPLALVSQQLIDKGTKKNLILFIILFLGLFAGGNRACMLSALGIPIASYLYKLYKNKQHKKLLFLLFMFSILGIFILYKLLSETQETSNAVKFGHLESYLIFFNDNIWTIIFGQGPGGLMYSLGFNQYSVQTEWSYIEMIRYFGIVGAFIIVLIYCYPLFVIIKQHKNFNSSSSLIIGYIFYLITAGTNPLLLGSTGMIVCFYCYSYVFYKNNHVFRNSNSIIVI